MLFYDEEFICALFDFLRCSSLHYMTWSCDFIFEKISSRAIERHSNWKFFIVLLHLTLTVIAFLSLSETHCVRMYTLLLYNRVSVELNWMKNFVRRRKKRATSSFRQKYYQKNVKLVAFYVVVVIFLCVEHGKFPFLSILNYVISSFFSCSCSDMFRVSSWQS